MSDIFNFTWGVPELEDFGFVQVYNFMLRNYTELGITRQEMLLIIHLASYSWNTPATDGSRPSQSTIAEEMGYSHPQRVSELVLSLEEKDMLIVSRENGKTCTYNLAPFATKCMSLFFGKTSTKKREGTSTKKRGRIRLKEEEEKDDGLSAAKPTIQDYKIYYKDKTRVDNCGKATYPPWVLTCDHCGGEVEITELDTPVECLCAMTQYTLLSKRPAARVRREHPAVEAYYTITGWKRGTLAPEWVQEIEKTVGEDPQKITFWRQVVKEWCGRSWNRGNVSTMLNDYFKEGRLPGTRKKKEEKAEIRKEKDGSVTIVLDDPYLSPHKYAGN